MVRGWPKCSGRADCRIMARLLQCSAVQQQLHLDIMVEDAGAAGARVLTLGAVKLDGENVYADPAGHPFCLIRRPRWAPPIPDDA